MRELNGKLALVTGGAKNVGKAIATELGRRGAHVLVNYFHSADEAKRTEAELTALGIPVTLLRASVARQDQVDRMFAEIEERYGYLDILVNNAADGALVPLSELTDDHLDKAIDTNYKGGLRCARAATPLMARRGGGAIITVSALGSSQMVMSGYLACAPAKAAAETVTRYLAVELAPQNIRVNTASAAMLTSEVADAFPRAEEMQRVIREATPMGRLGTKEELASLVAFLASDDARWITGQTVLADGGLSLGAALLSPPATTEPRQETDEIAIVGMGIVTPGANNPEEYWRLRTTGADLFDAPPLDRWDAANFGAADPAAEDKTYQDRAALITGFRPEPEAADSDLEHTTAWLRHSLAQALRGVRRDATDRVSFLVGYTPDGNQHLEEATVLAAMRRRAREVAAKLDLTDARRETVLARVDEVLTAHYHRGAGDPSRFFPEHVGRLAMAGLLPAHTELQMVDTACSSSMYAIDIGAKGLLLDQHDMAVCGGAFALTPRSVVMFAKLHGLSRSGAVSSLDDAADGVLFADGAGVVVLKRLSKAVRDGDQVLGVLSGFGTSSDGRGTAIYAPNPTGQDLAVRQALSTGVSPDDVDWLLTHATGTRAGDVAELVTVSEHFGQGAPTYLTSNKSLIGHTGWAAGVASVIEAILGLANESIPAQFRFHTPQREFRLADTSLRIPTETVPWPARADRPRLAGVSGFGFGGTNAHLIVREPGTAPPAPATPVPTDERVVIVGWSGHVPGLGGPDEIRAWLTGRGPAPSDSFGAQYPVPAFDRVRLPPATVRMMDRCQLMMIECAHQLAPMWERHSASTGVFAGNVGSTRAAVLLANRVYLDDTVNTLRRDASDLPELADLVAGLRDNVRGDTAPSNEDSFPGMMANIISARVANRFNLTGPNITLDSGLGSALAAIESAARYLRAGEVTLALAAGVNGNSLPEFEDVAGELTGHAGLAEGAFMFALTTERTAIEEGLPVLAVVGELGAGTPTLVECGEPARARYLGAAGAVGVLTALLGTPGDVRVQYADVRLDLAIPGAARAELPARFLDELGQAPLVRRQVPVLTETTPLAAGTPTAFLPPGVVILTDLPDLAERLDLPANATVNALPAAPARHVRVVTDLAASTTESLLTLHDLLFRTVKQAGEGVSSVVVLLLGAPDSPMTGLFTGLVKAIDLELPDCQTFAVGTAERDVAAGARLAEQESGLVRTFPVVFYDGARLVPTLRDEPVEVAGHAVLGENSVVVAVGGARGITAEVTKAVAEHFRPRVYVFGSNRLDDYPEEVFHGDDATFAASRAEFIRAGLRSKRTVAELNREFDQIGNARAARGTLTRLRELCGADRVTYLVCDVADEEAVSTAVQKVLADGGHVDLLINAAGRNHSALIRDKDFAEFQRIRDIKVRGYLNLKKAFADNPPAHWCNFGSLLGYFGQLGEADYAAGNDFLASAAGQGHSEFTIGWTFWDGVGMVGEKGSLANAHFKREGSYSDMTVAEGVHHFMRELHATNRRPSVVHMGAPERRTAEGLYPGYLTRGRFYLGRATDGVVAFDLERDGYLRHHLVRGVPTLPGAFVAELAGEAALELVPGATVIGYTDVRFHHFLYVHHDLPTPPKRIHATVTGRDGDRTIVHVTISTDVYSPGGVLLVKDRPHFTTNVVLTSGYPTAPRWEPWSDPERDVPAAESFRAEGAPIMLSGPFLCVDDIRRASGRARSTFRLRLAADDPLATSFIAPSFLFDGMVRTAFLTEADGRAAPVGAPTLIGAVEVFEPGNDMELMARYGSLGMYAKSRRTAEGQLEHHLVAVAPDGHVVATMTDVQTTIIDW